MSRKVLVATEKPFAKVAVTGIADILKGAGYEMVLLENYKDVADFHKAVADVDALIVRSDLVTPEVLEAGKKLKLVVRAGARVGQEVVRLHGSCAHVVDEHIEPKVSYERGEAWLAGTFTFVLYRHPSEPSPTS